jgi:hypothetical protein
MPKEYIERDAALAEIRKHLEKENLNNEASFYSRQGMGTAMCAVKQVPAADVAPVVRGRWIVTLVPEREMFWNNQNGYGGLTSKTRYQCSECGRIAIANEPYCHCGRLMDLKEEQND